MEFLGSRQDKNPVQIATISVPNSSDREVCDLTCKYSKTEDVTRKISSMTKYMEMFSNLDHCLIKFLAMNSDLQSKLPLPMKHLKKLTFLSDHHF